MSQCRHTNQPTTYWTITSNSYITKQTNYQTYIWRTTMSKFDSLLGNVIELTDEDVAALDDVSLDDLMAEVMNHDK